MFVISTVLWLLVAARITAANPSVRLPWFGSPPNRPRGVMLLQFLAVGSLAVGVQFVGDGFRRRGDRHVYDILWSVPFAVVVILAALVPYVRHNRRVRRAALRPAEGQQPGY